MSVRLPQTLLTCEKHGQASQVYEFAAELSRFLRAYGNIVGSAPLQIYSSGLIFAPQESTLRRTFDGKIRHWNPWIQFLPGIETDWKDAVRSFNGHEHRVRMVIFSADSKLLASVDRSGAVRIWHVDSGQQLHLFDMVLPKAYHFFIDFSRDSRYLLAFSENLRHFWKLNVGLVGTGELILQISDSHDIFCATFSTDSKRLIVVRRQHSKASDVTVQVLCLSSTICVRQFQLTNCALRLSSYVSNEHGLPNLLNKRMVVAKDGSLRLLNAAFFTAEVTMAQACLQEGSLSGQLLLLVPNDLTKTCEIYDMKTGDRIGAFQLEIVYVLQDTSEASVKPGLMFETTLAICQDVVPLLMVSLTSLGSIRVIYYDVRTFQQRQVFVFHAQFSVTLPYPSFSHDCQLMAVVSKGLIVTVQTAGGWKPRTRYEPLRACLSNDEGWISLTISAQEATLLLDARTAEIRLRLPKCDHMIFSDDSQLLAVVFLPITDQGCNRQHISIYNTQTLRKVLELPPHYGFVTGIGFSEDSSLLFTCTRLDNSDCYTIQVHHVLSPGLLCGAEDQPRDGPPYVFALSRRVGHREHCIFALSARLGILAYTYSAKFKGSKIFVHNFGSRPGYYVTPVDPSTPTDAWGNDYEIGPEAVAFSNHSNSLAAICNSRLRNQGFIRIWDAYSGQCMYIIIPENYSGARMRFFNPFNRLYGRCRVLDADSGKSLHTIVTHTFAGTHGFNPFDAELHAGVNPIIKPVEAENSARSMVNSQFAAILPVLVGSSRHGVL